MRGIKRSRHQTNGKKTVHGTGTLNHVPGNNIISSFLEVLTDGLEPKRAYSYVAERNYSPP